MNRLLVVALVAGAFLCTNTSEAQVQIKPIQGKRIQIKGGKVRPIQRPGRNQNAYLLRNKDVQKDINLSTEDQKKINDAVEDQQNAYKNLKNLKGKDRFKKIREISQATNKALQGVANNLNEKQKARLKQLQWQIRGPRTAAKELGITKEQQAKFRDIYKTIAKERRAIFQKNKGNRKAIQEANAKLNEKINKMIVESLTKEQQAKWKEMTGKPFQGNLRGGFGAIGRPIVPRPGIRPGQPRIQPNPIRIQVRPIRKKQIQPEQD